MQLFASQLIVGEQQLIDRLRQIVGGSPGLQQVAIDTVSNQVVWAVCVRSDGRNTGSVDLLYGLAEGFKVTDVSEHV